MGRFVAKKPSLLYLINGANAGGAEHGLLFLIQNGFFDDHNVTFAFLHQGTLWPAFKQACDNHGYTIESLYSCEGLSLKQFLKAFPWFLKLLWQVRPKIVVCSLKQSNIIGRVCAMTMPWSKFISFEHTATYTAKRGGKAMAALWAVCLWSTSWRVSTVWVDCLPTWHRMRWWFLPRLRRVHTVPLVMFKPEKIAYKKQHTLTQTVRLLAVGRLISPKRFDWAIEATAAVQHHIPEKKVELTLIGQGPESQHLQQLAVQSGITLHLPGYDAQWQKKLTDYDIFLMPSENEGLSMTTLEAMAAALPVVATHVGGLKHYGKHWQNMALVGRDQKELFCNTVVALLQNSVLRSNLGHFARETACGLFSQKSFEKAKTEAF